MGLKTIFIYRGSSSKPRQKGSAVMKRMAALLLLLLFCTGTVGSAEKDTSCSWFDFYIRSYVPTDEEIFAEFGSFTYLPSQSSDGRYEAVQSIEKRESDPVDMVYVYIRDVQSEETVDVFRAGRMLDFWGICWDRDSHDIWLQSGDVGIFAMCCSDGKWVEDNAVQRPGWLVSRWEVDAMRKRIKNMIGKELRELDKEYPDRPRRPGYIGFLKCENGYIAYQIKNDMVTAAVGFSLSSVLLCNEGMDLLSAELFDSCEPATYGELISAFGTNYYSNSNGIFSIFYIVDDGRLAGYFGAPNNKDEDWPVYGDASPIADAIDSYEARRVYFDGAELFDNPFGTICFGRYEQDDDAENGEEPIEWIILDKRDDGSLLLISKYILDAGRFNERQVSLYSTLTWEDSSLRAWLNEGFYRAAFSEEEKAAILITDLETENVSDIEAGSANIIRDRVFLLSATEAGRYFANEEARMCIPTKYATAQGAAQDDEYFIDGVGTCPWWLRSPGKRTNCEASINRFGRISLDAGITNEHFGIRPVIAVLLDKSEFGSDRNTSQHQ